MIDLQPKNHTIMKSYYLLILLLSFQTVMSCSKERLKNDEIRGTVQNLSDDQMLSDIPVILVQEFVPAAPFTPIERTILQSVETDAFGVFEFEPLTKTKLNRSYYVELAEREYLASHGWSLGDYETVNAVVKLTNNETTSLELTTVTFGFVDLNLINASDHRIELVGMVDNGKYNGKQFGLEVDPHSTGTSLHKKLMSGNHEVTWLLYSDSGEIELVQSLSVPVNDTTEWTVHYP